MCVFDGIRKGNYFEGEPMAGVCEGEWIGDIPGDESQTLTRCHSCVASQLYQACWWKSVCGRDYNLKGIKGEIYIFSFLGSVSLLLYLIS